MPKRWLFKTEPNDYSYAELERERRTVWDGLGNAQALIYLRQCKPGDLAFIYHTGKERAIIGISKVVSDPYPDPWRDELKRTVVDVEAVAALPRPVTLKEIKIDGRFADWQLVTHGRLSAMPVTVAHWKAVEKLAKG